MMVKSQKGAVSLVIVTLTTVLISVLTVATTKLMTGEVRQSIDGESGIKAYYLAESASEETIYAIRRAIANGVDLSDMNQNCDRDGVPNAFAFSGALPQGITCRRIAVDTNKLENSYIEKSGTHHYDLSRNHFDRIELEWDKDDMPPPNDRAFVNNLPDIDAKSPPFLEVTRVTYTDTDSGPATVVDPSSISVKSIILSPTASSHEAWLPVFSGIECGSIANEVIRFNQCHGSTGGSVKVACDETNDKRCKATLTDFIPPVVAGEGQRRVVLRLRPYYNSMRYNMSLYQGSTPITFRLDKIEIDITAVVGGSYRRTLDQFDVTANPSPIDALHADNEICKNLIIKSIAPSGIDPLDEVRDGQPCNQVFD